MTRNRSTQPTAVLFTLSNPLLIFVFSAFSGTFCFLTCLSRTTWWYTIKGLQTISWKASGLVSDLTYCLLLYKRSLGQAEFIHCLQSCRSLKMKAQLLSLQTRWEVDALTTNEVKVSGIRNKPHEDSVVCSNFLQWTPSSCPGVCFASRRLQEFITS